MKDSNHSGGCFAIFVPKDILRIERNEVPFPKIHELIIETDTPVHSVKKCCFLSGAQALAAASASVSFGFRRCVHPPLLSPSAFVVGCYPSVVSRSPRVSTSIFNMRSFGLFFCRVRACHPFVTQTGSHAGLRAHVWVHGFPGAGDPMDFLGLFQPNQRF